MKIFDNNEGKEWLRINTNNGDINDKYLKQEFNYNIAYLIPKDSGRKTFLAKAIVNNLSIKEEGCFGITGYGLWPSSENQAVFYGYRKSIGENRTLGEAPWHIFNNEDIKDLGCLIAISLYFFWDVVIVEGLFRTVIKMNHDEILTLYMKDEERFLSLKKNFDNCDLKILQK